MCLVSLPSPARTVRTADSLSATWSAERKLSSSSVSATGAGGGMLVGHALLQQLRDLALARGQGRADGPLLRGAREPLEQQGGEPRRAHGAAADGRLDRLRDVVEVDVAREQPADAGLGPRD